jgi:hypothetical protein
MRIGHREIQLAAVLSSHRASRHMAAPSLGHYASLSFVVIGREQRTEIFLWERLLAAILRFKGFNDFYDFN